MNIYKWLHANVQSCSWCHVLVGWFISDVLHSPKEADWSNCLNFSKIIINSVHKGYMK